MDTLRQALRPLARLNDQLKRTTNVYMVLVAALIGVVGGYGAVGFRFLLHWMQEVVWQTREYSLEHVRGLPSWWVLLAPAAGGVVVGIIVRFWAREARGHGVPEVMEAMVRRNGRIRPRVALAKALASAICIGTGGSVGREGPMVQIGAALASTGGQALRVGARRMRTLVGCGAAAGIAATFNAPVAGALFAVEILLGDFAVPQFSPIVISSVTATVVARQYLGELPAFTIPKYALESPLELLAYVVLGFLAALVGILFIRTLEATEDAFERSRAPVWLTAPFGGLCVGALALLFPGVLGVGYEAMNEALMGSPTAVFLVLLLLAKLAAVCVTLASGGSGGIFAPSLFLGAVLGAAVGTLLQLFFPGGPAPPGAYALVGMGAVVAATTHAPITAIIIIFELTTDYRIILPLMMACIVSTLVSSRVHPESIYTIKLVRRGIRIRAGQDVNVLRRIPVREVMRPDPPRIDPAERLDRILELVLHSRDNTFYVVDADGRYQGAISLQDLRQVLPEAELLRHLVVAEDLAGEGPSVPADAGLDQVITRLELGYRDELPVLENGRLVGAVRLEDVLERYRRELFRMEMAGTLAAGMAGNGDETVMHRVGRYVLAELQAPPALWNRSLVELDLRRRHGVNVLLVRPEDGAETVAEPRMAEPGTQIQAGDRLVVFGTREGIEALRRA